MQLCKPYHYTLIEAVEPFKLHPMSMSYINEVLDFFAGSCSLLLVFFMFGVIAAVRPLIGIPIMLLLFQAGFSLGSAIFMVFVCLLIPTC